MAGCNDDDGGDRAIDPPTDGVSTSAQMDWSPDGTTIAVAWGGRPSNRRNGIYLINTSDWSTTEVIVSPGSTFVTPYSSPTWSADGEWIAFGQGAQLYKIKANG